MAWKFGVYGGNTGNTKDHPAFNGQVFGTQDEANRAVIELLQRWFGPEHYVLVEVNEEVNYFFPTDSNRPIHTLEFKERNEQ
jgi:hypothetical protein